MKNIVSLLLTAALFLNLTACGGPQPSGSDTPGTSSEVSSQPGNEVQPVDTPFALAIYPEYSIHPALARNRANLTLVPLLYEPLFQVDESFQAQPVLCESYASDAEKLVWTFTLRTGISFSEGTPFTGKEAAAALNLARSARGRYSGRLSCVESIRGDETTLTITLNRPCGQLPLLLDIPIALGDEDRPAGTGPYVLRGAGDEMTLSLREDWWQGKNMPLDRVSLREVEKSDELIFAFSTGDVSLVDVDLMGTNALGYSGNYETWDYATTDLIYLGFNTREGRVCSDPALRQALVASVDRETITQTIFASHAVPAALPVHPDSELYHDRDAEKMAYAPEKLVDQVEELRESRRQLTLLVNSENTAKISTAEFIAYQLESAGLKIVLEKLPFADYAAALKAGEFDLYIGEVVLTADFNLSDLLAPNGSMNYGGWYSEEITGLLAAASAAEAGETMPYRLLYAHLAEQAPIAAICFKNGCVLTQWGRLSGLSPLRSDVFHGLEHWIMD